MSSPRARSGAAPARHPAGSGRTVEASLTFARRADGRTFLQRSRTPYPFHITRPFHLDGDPPGLATLYLQSAAGGIYAGDRLALDLRAGGGTAVQVTTQASTIVHAARQASASAAVTARLWVGADALLEWLPDPTILLADARLHSRTEVTLAPGGRALIGEALLTHAPWDTGGMFQHYAGELAVVAADGRRIALDRMRVDGSTWRDSGGGRRAHAILFGLGQAATDSDLAALRGALQRSAPDAYAGISVLRDDNGWCARVLARDAVRLRAATDVLWRTSRRIMTGREPPRRPK